MTLHEETPRRRDRSRCALLLLAIAAWLGVPAALQAAAPGAAFDAAFEDTFRRFRLPGLAVGVVEDGEVVFRRTAGERAAGSGEAVDPATLFKVASLSKAMTTGLLARLVDQGRLAWDDPVAKHLPGFRMHDPWVGANMQVRDLLIHNSGLGKGAGDLMLWPEPNDFTRADVIAGLAHLVPTHSFRSHYAYDNILYIVAGEVAAAAGGRSYEALMQSEVFAPLGMQRCQAGGFDPARVGNVAQPHRLAPDGNVVVRADGEHVPALTSAAAGGIRCSLDDMLAWLRMWLRADPATTGWLSEAQRAALWTPHMAMPVPQRLREQERAHFHAYGYGWRLSDANGQLKVAHTGTLAGMYSLLVLLPERRAGFVILTNGYGEQARAALGQLLSDHYTAPDRRHDLAHHAALLEAQPQDPAATAPDVSARVPVAAASMVGSLGIWRDPWFGDVALCERAGEVRFESARSPLLAGTVEQLGQQLLVDWDDPSVDAMPWLHFASTPPRLTLSHVDPAADFSYDYADLAFARVADCPGPPARAP